MLNFLSIIWSIVFSVFTDFFIQSDLSLFFFLFAIFGVFFYVFRIFRLLNR